MSTARDSWASEAGLVRDGIGAIIRWSPLVVAAAVLSAGSTQFVLDRAADDSQAVARVGLTDEVTWPFYDVVRDGIATLAETDDVGSAVREELGGEFVAFDVDVPEAQAAVDLAVTATTPEAADRGAVAAADDVVRRNLVSRRAVAQAELDLLNEVLATAEADAANKATAVEDLIDGYDGLSDEIAIRQVDESVRVAIIERDAAVRAAGDSASSVLAMERTLVSVDAEVKFVRLEGASESEVSSAVIGAVGLAAALLAMLIVVIGSRENGWVRSSEQIRSVVGVDVISLDGSDALLMLPRQLLKGGKVGAAVVGVAGGDHTSFDVLVKAVEAAGMKVNNDSGITVVDLEGPSVDGSPPSVAATSAVVIVKRKRSRIRDLKARVDLLESSGLPVAGVVLERS